MEPLGRKSGDSFRSMSSYRQSYRSRSYKKQLEQEVTKTQSAEKVRRELLLFTICVWVSESDYILLACFHMFMFHELFCSYAFVILFFHFLSFFFFKASVCHEWIIEHLWTWTGFQLSHRRHSSPASSYQEAKPESDQWHFRCEGGKRRHPRPSQEWLFWFLKFWKNHIYVSQVTSEGSTHNRHQSDIGEQPNPPWQRVLGGKCWGDREQCFC